MNILIVNYEYPPLGGGGGVSTQNIAEGLASRGHNVFVLTTHFRGELFRENKPNLQIFRVPVLGRTNRSYASMISMLIWPFLAIWVGIWVCLKYRIEIINTHFFAPSGPVGFLLSLFFGLPNVIYAHGADVFDPSRMHLTPSGRGFLAWCLRASMKIQIWKAAAVWCQSNDIKSRILFLNPNIRHEIKILPLAFKFNFIEKQHAANTKKELNLISIGRIVPRKGFIYLIEAMKHVPQEIRLVVVGDGPQRAELQEMVDSMGLTQRVEFVGFVEEDKKADLLKKADCFVLTSTHEGQGIVFLEAMAAGLGIIATNLGGQLDILEDGKNAILVEPQDVKAIAGAITKVFESRELLARLSTNNLQKAKMYDLASVVSAYESEFLNLISRQKPN